MIEPSEFDRLHEAFRKELQELLNRHSMENGCDTPDYLLADYLIACLAAFNTGVHMRDSHHGFRPMRFRVIGVKDDGTMVRSAVDNSKISNSRWLDEHDEPLRELMYDYRNSHPTHAENYFQRVVRWVKQNTVQREWSDWQQPVMDGYRMECCDCGLLHEVQFRVYRVDERPAPDETYGPEMPVTDYRIQMRMRRM